jgi:hypothetical protein
MLLLFLTNLAIKTDNPYLDYFDELPTPTNEPVTPIPACTEDVYGLDPCIDFFYTPNDPGNVAVQVRVNSCCSHHNPIQCFVLLIKKWGLAPRMYAMHRP